MRKNLKKYVPHILGTVLILAILGCIVWVSVRQTKEGMDNNDDFVNASELLVRMMSDLSDDEKEHLQKARNLSPEKQVCLTNLVNDNKDALLDIPRLARSKASREVFQQNAIIIGLDKCGVH